MDVKVDYDVLNASRTTFKSIKSVLTSATDAVSDVSGEAAAQQKLRERLNEMSDMWGNSLRKLGNYAEESANGLEGIVDAFKQFDEKLESSMNGEEAGA